VTGEVRCRQLLLRELLSSSGAMMGRLAMGPDAEARLVGDEGCMMEAVINKELDARTSCKCMHASKKIRINELAK
jgi:hypothetical protein